MSQLRAKSRQSATSPLLSSVNQDLPRLGEQQSRALRPASTIIMCRFASNQGSLKSVRSEGGEESEGINAVCVCT